MTPSRILLFGGSFNPPHLRHVSLAGQAAAAIRADQIRVIPTNINPQRQAEPPISGVHRAAMLRLAFAAVPGVIIDTVELDRGGASFMVDTLREFRRTFPAAKLFLLLGGDQVLNFYTWKDPQEILALATPVVVPRAPLDAVALEQDLMRRHGRDVANLWKPWILPLDALTDSSTQLREAFAGGKSPHEKDIDPEVLKYIREHSLYT